MRTAASAALALVIILAAPPALTQVPPVTEPDVCYGCHTELEDVGHETHVHTAFKDGKCSACHNPHASRHAARLNNEAGPLCLSCHADVESQIKQPSAHVPAATGNCLACHSPHASANLNQLVKGELELCGTCHAAIETWQSRSVVHAPVASDDCLACHVPHGGSHNGLLADSMPALCLNCHDPDPAFNRAHKGYDLSHANCATCHDPHSSNKPGLVMANQHGPFQGGNCEACHAAGDNAFSLKADVRTVCSRCHSSVKAAAQMTYSTHLAGDQSCMNCHNAHASPANALLTSGTQTVCMKCHAKSERWAGKPRESLLTHNGLDCASCHTPHGSDNARYLKTTGAELCTGCHERAHSSSHPIGASVIDPRTKEPVTCLSCHQLHDAKFEPYLPLSPEMDLCIQCHRR